jgi:hypothetical protein
MYSSGIRMVFGKGRVCAKKVVELDDHIYDISKVLDKKDDRMRDFLLRSFRAMR